MNRFFTAAAAGITAMVLSTALHGQDGIYISKDGKVGVGTEKPAALLDINGTCKIRDTADFANGLVVSRGATNFTTGLNVTGGSVTFTNSPSYFNSGFTVSGAGNAVQFNTGAIFSKGLTINGSNTAQFNTGAAFSGGVTVAGGTAEFNTAANFNGTTKFTTRPAFANGLDAAAAFSFSGAGKKLYVNNWGDLYIGNKAFNNATRYPLEVEAFNNVTVNERFAFFTLYDQGYGLSVHTDKNYSRSISMRAKGAIATDDHFFCYSDQRLKTNVSAANTEKDLELLKKLTVVNYQYKDMALHGADTVKGFIAQQVEQVFPQAVAHITDFIPDIFTMSTVVSEENGAAEIALPAAHGLKTGDRVRLFTASQEYEVTVTAYSGRNFRFSDPAFTGKARDSVFVYGREVADARMVDYDRIFSMNVAATQQLAGEVDELKRQNEALKSQNEALQRQNEVLNNRCTASENRLTAIEEKLGTMGGGGNGTGLAQGK